MDPPGLRPSRAAAGYVGGMDRADGDLGSYHPLVRAVAEALRRHVSRDGKEQTGGRLLVAVSGGADSVALLRALLSLAGRRGWEMELAVGHVQHHLRHEAEDDARFVAELAEKHGLAYLRADLDLSETSGANLEAAGRLKRYEALAVMAQSLGATHVLTAHQAEDQLETLLMRLLRGASVRGWSGMAWQRRLLAGSDVRLARPMLGVRRQDVLDYLHTINQSWREDHTNADVTRWRARLRRDVLPVLRELRPDAAARALAATEHFRDLSRLLDEQIARAADHVLREGETRSLDRMTARLLPGVVLAGLVRRVLLEMAAGSDKLSRQAITPVVRAIRDGQGGQRRFEIGGAVVVVTRELVSFERRSTKGS